MTGPASPTARPRGQLWRPIVATVLLVLVVLLAPLSVVARWTHTHVSDTDGYLATVAPLAKNPAVTAAITDSVTDAITQRVDAPILTQVLRTQVQRFVDSDAFASLWKTANRTAHRQLVGVFTGEGTQQVTVENGKVSLSLAGVTETIKQSLLDRGITAASLIPAIDVSFTIFDSDHIVAVQRGFRVLDATSGPLPFATAALLAAAIVIARRRLRVALIGALCVSAGMGLLAIALAIVRQRYLEALPADVPAAAARAVFDALAAPMWSVLWGWLIAGLVAAAVAAIGWTVWTLTPHHRQAAAPAGAATSPQEKS